MSRRVARVLIITTAILWGTSFPVIRLGLQFMSASLFLVLRFALACLIMFVLLLFLKRRVLNVLFDRFIVYTAILNALGYTLQFLGQKYTYATNAAVLVNTSPIFTAIFANYLLNEKLDIKRIFAIAITFLGIVTITFSSYITFRVIGDTLCLLAGLVWGLYVAEAKKIARNNIDGLVLLFSWFFYSALFGIFLVPLEGVWISLNILTVLIIVYVSIFCTIVPFLLWFRALNILEATTSSNYFMLEIIISALIEYLFMSYTPSILTILGAILIMLGVYLTDRFYQAKVELN